MYDVPNTVTLTVNEHSPNSFISLTLYFPVSSRTTFDNLKVVRLLTDSSLMRRVSVNLPSLYDHVTSGCGCAEKGTSITAELPAFKVIFSSMSTLVNVGGAAKQTEFYCGHVNHKLSSTILVHNNYCCIAMVYYKNIVFICSEIHCFELACTQYCTVLYKAVNC